MASFQTSVGSSSDAMEEAQIAGARAQRQQEWRRPQQLEARSPINWEKEEYATPQPPPDTKFGKYVQPRVDLPYLHERRIRVKAKAPATYYDGDGNPIP